MMRPVLSREEYLRLRDGGCQKSNLSRIRQGEEKLKVDLVQMNYSCLPNDDGTLKGSKRASMSVCMDIDFNAPEGLSEEEKKAWLKEQMAKVPELVLSKKDELVPLMLERSATKGYHLAFRRRPDLDQVGNLKWASELLGIKYDKQAKDITRVYFTTTADAGELLYLDDEIFSVAGSDSTVQTTPPDGTPPNSGREGCAEKEVRESPSQSNAKINSDVWGEHNWHANLMAVLSVGVGKLMSRDQLMGVIAVRLPNYSQTEDCRKLVDYFYEKYDADKGFMNASLREINAKAQTEGLFRPPLASPNLGGELEAEDEQLSTLNSQLASRKLPQGVRDSVEAVGESLAMPTVNRR